MFQYMAVSMVFVALGVMVLTSLFSPVGELQPFWTEIKRQSAALVLSFQHGKMFEKLKGKPAWHVDSAYLKSLPEDDVPLALVLQILSKHPNFDPSDGLTELPLAERNVYALNQLADEYLNGGIIQYFGNCGSCTDDAIGALNEIGADELCRKLEEAKLHLENGSDNISDFSDLNKPPFKKKLMAYIMKHVSEFAQLNDLEAKEFEASLIESRAKFMSGSYSKTDFVKSVADMIKGRVQPCSKANEY